MASGFLCFGVGFSCLLKFGGCGRFLGRLSGGLRVFAGFWTAATLGAGLFAGSGFEAGPAWVFT